MYLKQKFAAFRCSSVLATGLIVCAFMGAGLDAAFGAVDHDGRSSQRNLRKLYRQGGGDKPGRTSLAFSTDGLETNGNGYDECVEDCVDGAGDAFEACIRAGGSADECAESAHAAVAACIEALCSDIPDVPGDADDCVEDCTDDAEDVFGDCINTGGIPDEWVVVHSGFNRSLGTSSIRSPVTTSSTSATAIWQF